MTGVLLLLRRLVRLAGVTLDVRAPWLRFDRARCLPYHVELAVGLDFADEHALVQMVVLLIHLARDAARCLEGLAGHGGDHLVNFGGLGFLYRLLPHVDADVDKVIAAMAGQTFKAPSGILSKMDEKNHHLHKSVFIGEVKADGQFNVVWKTPGPVKAKPWSPYIDGNAGKPDEPAK